MGPQGAFKEYVNRLFQENFNTIFMKNIKNGKIKNQFIYLFFSHKKFLKVILKPIPLEHPLTFL